MSVRKLFDLGGKIALVTGGSRGLGLQIAESLGEMGAKLALTARKADELEEAREHLARQSIEALPLPCDLSQPQAIEPMLSRVLERYGRVDILVNNAGATWGAPAEDHPLEAWQKLVNLNLTGTFLVTQAVGKRSMIPNRYGRIVNVASIAGLRGNPVGMLKTLAYNTTKGGVVNFTRTLAAEWGEYGITVNAIAPGFFPSKMTKGALERIGDKIIAHVPLKRVRAALRLVRDAVGKDEYARENALLRDAGRALRAARDAEVLLGVVTDLAHTRRRSPLRRRSRARAGTVRARGPSACSMCRHPSCAATSRIRSRRHSTASTSGACPSRCDRSPAPGSGAIALDLVLPTKGRAAKLKDRAAKVAKALGDDHDLAIVLPALPRQADAKRLRKKIGRMRAKLQHKALKRAAKLYKRKPKAFVKRVAP